MAHKLKIFCENPSDGELSNELKSKYQPNEYLLANETNAVLRGATIGTKLIYDVIDCDDITLGYDTAPSEFSAQVAAITKGLLAVTNGDMATNEKLGTIKVGYQADSSTENRNYPLKVDANGNAYTNVPWSTDTSGTPNNTPNALVKRDSNGNFSANTITANLAGNASTADRINTKKSIGSHINPVYVDSNGEVKACSHSFSDYYDIHMNHIECSSSGGTITISNDEAEKLTRLGDQILFLKLNYTDMDGTDYFKFNDRRQDGMYLTYTFANIANTVEITFTGDRYETLDEILIYPTTTSIAMYASSDYSKGTIEERLTKLGFSEGSFVVSDGATVATNSIKKQGKFVIANLAIGLGIATVPSEFAPKEDTIVSASGVDNVSGLTYVDHAIIKTDGSIEFKNDNDKTITPAVFEMQNVGWEIK